MKRVLDAGSALDRFSKPEKLGCISLFMKDNHGDKACGIIIASMDGQADLSNKQPHSCHCIHPTDYKTPTSLYRSGCGIRFLAVCFGSINFTKTEVGRGKISSLINGHVKGNLSASELRAPDDGIFVSFIHSMV